MTSLIEEMVTDLDSAEAAPEQPADKMAPDPDWLTAVIGDYQAAVANTFLLHGNVFDYVDQPDRDQIVRDYLAGRLAKHFSVVMYAPDEGITFPGEASESLEIRAMAGETRKRFLAGAGLEPQLDEADALLQQAGQGELPTDIPREPARAIPRLVDFVGGADGSPQVWATDADGQTLEPRQQISGGDGSGKRAVVIVDRLDLITPPGDKGTMQDARLSLLSLLHRVGTMPGLNGFGNLLILLAPSLEEVHPDLTQASSGIRTIEIEAPDYDQRLRYLERLLPEKGLTLEGLTLDQLAGQMAGLKRRHMEDVALRAKLAGGVMTPSLVKARKKELVAQEFSEVLTVLEPDVTLAQVGGHVLAKRQLERLLRAVASTDPIVRARIPKGILLSGPAGTGKTFLAQALANALGWNILEFDPSKVNGSLVGQSERLLAKAQRGARAFAPCVIFIDEIDQRVKRVASGSGGGGDQAAANQFGKMLEFLGDPTTRGRVLTIAASNWGSRIDAALLRPGRLDWKIPLLAPEEPVERAEILERLLIKQGFDGTLKRFPLPMAGVIKDIAATTDGWTPAELERLVNLACELVDLDGVPLSEALQQAGGRLVSTTQEVEAMTYSALAVCDDKALVPTRWQPYVAKPAPAAPEASARRPAPQGPRTAQDLAV